jgi:DNA-directed RNA polymerase alpha subunit
MLNIFLKEKIKELEIDSDIIRKLNDNNIYTINDLWNSNRIELKKLKLTDNQINQIIIKMQLYGIDLNRRIYNKN